MAENEEVNSIEELGKYVAVLADRIDALVKLDELLQHQIDELANASMATLEALQEVVKAMKKHYGGEY